MTHAPEEKSLRERLKDRVKQIFKPSDPESKITGRRADRRWFYLPARKLVAIQDPALQNLVGEKCVASKDSEGRTYLSQPRTIRQTVFVGGKPKEFRVEHPGTMRRIDLLAAPGHTRSEKKSWLRAMARQYALNMRATAAAV